MVKSISLETAKAVVDSTEQKAREIDNPMVIAITNSKANLIAQHRMDGAWLASVSISRNKAYTAAALEMGTDELAEPTQPGESLYGLQTTDDDRIVIFGGGYPLVKNSEVVGALGVSGGQVSQDMEVAQAGLEAYTEFVR